MSLIGVNSPPMTYEIMRDSCGNVGIKCLECDTVSWNPNDVQEKYCGGCHEFHVLKSMRLIGVMMSLGEGERRIF